MKRQLKFVTVFPIDTYFTWQCHLWLESLKEIKQSENAIVIVFVPLDRQPDDKWKEISSLYPEAEFNYIKDDGSVDPLLKYYIPILRPYCMREYCRLHPEISDDAVLYCDCDVLFMPGFDVSHLLDDDIVYGSNTNSYISASYFDSKIKDVLITKVLEYKRIDVLDESAKIIGIDRATCEKYNTESIGTQYLLKNTNAEFWDNVFNKCIPLITYLGDINKRYFANENKGFQKWTSDMWAVLWEIWRRGQDTKVVKEMDFAWATDKVEKLENYKILHNAGVTADYMNNVPYFFKGKYISGRVDPTTDEHLKIVLSNEESKRYCTWWYAHKLMKLKEKYSLNY